MEREGSWNKASEFKRSQGLPGDPASPGTSPDSWDTETCPPSWPSLTLIIPVRNAKAYFSDCLHSISRSRIQPDQLIIVADGEPEDDLHLARSSGAVVLRTPTPRGPAYARNLGAKYASCDILLFIDADVMIKVDTVEQVQRFFFEHPEYDAMIGSYDDKPGAPNFLSQYKNIMHHWVHQHSLEEASTFWGACGAIRRKVFLEHDGFNTGYDRPSIEDIELGYRLKESGKRIRLQKSIQVTHLKEWRVRTLLRSDIFERAIPWSKLCLIKNKLTNDLNLSMSNRFSIVLVFLAMGMGAAVVVDKVFLAFSAICLLLLIVLHRRLYLFFLRRRGAFFTAAAMCWHWLFFLYSGGAFLWCCLEYKMAAVSTLGAAGGYRPQRKGALRWPKKQ
jgi:glycosyltransferase involved in cell wall biosynthesis